MHSLHRRKVAVGIATLPTYTGQREPPSLSSITYSIPSPFSTLTPGTDPLAGATSLAVRVAMVGMPPHSSLFRHTAVLHPEIKEM